MITRRSFLATAATVGAASVAGIKGQASEIGRPSRASLAQAPAGSPNILIFMPDQQNGATVLPGSPVIKPFMDKFMREAVTFNSAHCPAPHCCPSRASFMSGLYPSEHGVYNNVSTETAIHSNPYPGTPYWGLDLKKAGYQMGYAGKLHVGRDVTPETCGFEDLGNFSGAGLAIDRTSEKWKKSREEKMAVADRRVGEILRHDWTNLLLYRTQPDAGPKGYEDLHDYKIMQAGIAGMQRMAAAGNPWCVMISNSGSHDTYDAPNKFVEMYDPTKIELPASFQDTLDDKPRIYQRQRYQEWSQLSDKETKQALLHYYAKCTMQDAIFGEMLEALEKTGQADNTIVIYVSDHGDYMGAHGLWMKGVPAFREAYHVPAVVRWPKKATQPGRQVDAFVDQVDWAPTVLEACGVTSSKKLSGKSLLPWIKGDIPTHWRQAFFSQMNGVELYYTQRIVMTKEWKYVFNGFDYDELYDLKNDPHEMRNLAFPDLAATRAQVLSGNGLSRDATVPWPQLPEKLEEVRKDLVRQMWDFAGEHKDMIFNGYGTVALEPYGPGAGKDPGSADVPD